MKQIKKRTPFSRFIRKVRNFFIFLFVIALVVFIGVKYANGQLGFFQKEEPVVETVEVVDPIADEIEAIKQRDTFQKQIDIEARKVYYGEEKAERQRELEEIEANLAELRNEELGFQ